MALTVGEVAAGEGGGKNRDSPGPVIKASHVHAEKKHAQWQWNIPVTQPSAYELSKT